MTVNALEEEPKMFEVTVANEAQPAASIRELSWEYLPWMNQRVLEEFGVSFDIAAIADDDMRHLAKFMPPKGRLLLAYVDDQIAGMVCLTELDAGIAEVRRMYVRPPTRQRGLGRRLLTRLLEEARQSGYERVRLDSARFMKAAHELYRTSGFREIEPYAGSEVPSAFQPHWIFMELTLPRHADQQEAV